MIIELHRAFTASKAGLVGDYSSISTRSRRGRGSDASSDQTLGKITEKCPSIARERRGPDDDSASPLEANALHQYNTGEREVFLLSLSIQGVMVLFFFNLVCVPVCQSEVKDFGRSERFRPTLISEKV